MAISLDLTNAEEVKILRAFAAWTINGEVYSPFGEALATFHDSGTSLSAALTSDEVMALSTLTEQPGFPEVRIVPLEAWPRAVKYEAWPQ